MRAIVVSAAITLGLSACTAAPQPEPPPDAEAGRGVAERLCVSCHSVDKASRSPNPDAPPLSAVLSYYPPDILAEDLRRSVSISHLKMPTFHFGGTSVPDLVAYLEQIRED